MIDIDKLEKAVARIVSVSVGDQLATMKGSIDGSTSGEVPAIVLERNFEKGGSHRKPNLPDYPYCSVTHNRIVDDGNEITNIFLDGDDYVYQTSKIVSVNIKFIGNRKNSADSIANRMHMSLEVEHFRLMLESFYGQSVALRNKSDVVPSNLVYQDTYMEMRSFDIFLSVIDEYSIPAAMVGTFDRVEVDSDLTPLPPVPPEIPVDDTSLGQENAELGNLFFELARYIPPPQEATEGGQLNHYEDDPAPMAVTFSINNNN